MSGHPRFLHSLSRPLASVVMAIPITLLWGVQMSFRRKAALTGIFSLGVITTVVAIIRITAITTSGRQPDTSWSYMWNLIEQGIGESSSKPHPKVTILTCNDWLAIIIACLSSFRSLFHQQASRAHNNPPSHKPGSSNIFLRNGRPEGKFKARLYDTLTELTHFGAMTTNDTSQTHVEDGNGSSNNDLNSYRCNSLEGIIPPEAINVQTEFSVQGEKRTE